MPKFRVTIQAGGTTQEIDVRAVSATAARHAPAVSELVRLLREQYGDVEVTARLAGMVPVTIYPTDEQVRQMRQVEAETGQSLSRQVRDGIDRVLERAAEPVRRSGRCKSRNRLTSKRGDGGSR